MSLRTFLNKYGIFNAILNKIDLYKILIVPITSNESSFWVFIILLKIISLLLSILGLIKLSFIEERIYR